MLYVYWCVCVCVCRTVVNGHRVTERVTTKHGDRILLGNSHLFRLSCPRQQEEGAEGEGTEPPVQLMDYEAAMNEINTKELHNGELAAIVPLKPEAWFTIIL